MTDEDFTIELFCRIDDQMTDRPKHRQAALYPSEIVTLAVLFALKGVGNRAFYRWISKNLAHLFPTLPERTRLFRLFATHQSWSKRFMAAPSLLGVADTYGIELIHPIREGRSRHPIGKKGQSNHRWIVGCKLGLILNHLGQIVAWDCAPANVHDSAFLPLLAQFQEEMIILTDQGFHARVGDPPNLKVCDRGEWNGRMLVETVLSMLTVVCHFKKVGHRLWACLQARLAFTMAAFNLLTTWHGLQPDESGYVRLSIAEFSL